MPHRAYIFDPTASDKQSKVRGIGRYLQILKENFPKNTIFTDSLKRISADSTFINPFFNLLLPPLVMRRIARKQIAVIHDLIPLKYPKHFPIGIKGRLNVFLNELALRNYDMIITDSVASKKDIVQLLRLPENKVKVVYPCLPKVFINSEFRVQNSEFNPESRNNKKNKKNNKNSEFYIHNSKFCLYVGDATWNKNLVNLAKAIKILNVTCVFVGKAFENLESRIQNSELENPWLNELTSFYYETKNDKRFIFEGFVDDYKLIKFYQQARVNILPSRDEGFGFSYLEATSQNCPSVLAGIPVLHEISNGQALFADPNNPHEIANAIGEVYFNNDLRKSLGEKAYQRSKFFSPSQFKKTFLKIIQEL